MSNIRVLLFGDVVGSAGQAVFQKHIARLRKEYNADAVIVNGENSADGKGITPKIVRFFKHHGVDVITTGNHIWQKKDVFPYLAEKKDLLRPANFPSMCPGTGMTTFTSKAYTVGVVNIQGRVFMREHVDCPFRAMDSLLTYLQTKTHIIIVDFHAETTAEKAGMAYYLDGRVSAVVGTHTHVQTADERILPQGTAFITDLGMAGSLNSMIGMKKDAIIQHLISQMPTKFEVETTPPFILCGVVIDINPTTGKATHIERIKIIEENLHIDAATLASMDHK